jgi:hypothetical protein
VSRGLYELKSGCDKSGVSKVGRLRALQVLGLDTSDLAASPCLVRTLSSSSWCHLPLCAIYMQYEVAAPCFLCPVCLTWTWHISPLPILRLLKVGVARSGVKPYLNIDVAL